MTKRSETSRLPASRRDDGRGHWPKGVRRSALRAGCLELLRAARTAASLRQIGAALGCSARTVHKWLTGINQPSPAWQAKIVRVLGRREHTKKSAK